MCVLMCYTNADNCTKEADYDLNQCGKPPIIPSIKNQTLSSRNLTCTIIQNYIKCLNKSIEKLCNQSSNILSNNTQILKTNLKALISLQMDNLEKESCSLIFNLSSNNFIQNFTTGITSDTITSSTSKATSLMIRNITTHQPDLNCHNLSMLCKSSCEYPSKNLLKNRILFCDKLFEYINCAKCKMVYCEMNDSALHMKKVIMNQETIFNIKCKKYKTPSVSTIEPRIINKEEIIQKLDSFTILFDHINLKNNTIDIMTSPPSNQLHLNILNATEIFKGIRNGAVYLHSKTALSLNLWSHSESLCLTSSLKDPLICEKGWTISFWLKVSSVNLFDKTIIKFDSFGKRRNPNDTVKYFMVKISNYDIIIQFLNNKKLWAIDQSIVWKSEWSLVTISWHQFDGLMVFINNNLFYYQQTFEYFNRELTTSLNLKDESSIIYFGLNNRITDSMRKKFWSKTNENRQSSILFTTAYAEAVLLDELTMFNYKISTKQIAEIYLREYRLMNEYDSLSDIMYFTSSDAKQVETLLLNGVLAKKVEDDWQLTLNGQKQLVVIPNLFDACINDASELCDFGFTLVLWLRLTYNFVKYPLQSTFDQSLFYFGSQDFKNGIEGFLTILVNPTNSAVQTNYVYILTLNMRNDIFKHSKFYRIHLKSITDLNELSYLSIHIYSQNEFKLHVHWLNTVVEEIDKFESTKINDYTPTYARFIDSPEDDLGIRLPSSQTIGLLGDIKKQSFFNVQHIELRNYGLSLNDVDYDYKSLNPTVFEFDSLEKIFEISSIHGNPKIIDTRFGKSLLFSRSDQKLIFKNVSQSCFGNLNLCPHGYSLKLWLCFTSLSYDRANNHTGRVSILTNSDKNTHGLTLMYDLAKSKLLVYAKTYLKWFEIEIDAKFKLFSWYTIVITIDQIDGLRLYINNRLLEHALSQNVNDNFNANHIKSTEFIIGNFNSELDSIDTSFEFILHKLIQYDVRKYPDEIVGKNVVIQGITLLPTLILLLPLLFLINLITIWFKYFKTIIN